MEWEQLANVAMQLPVVSIFAYIVFKMLELAREERKEIHETLGTALDRNTAAITDTSLSHTQLTSAITELRKDFKS